MSAMCQSPKATERFGFWIHFRVRIGWRNINGDLSALVARATKTEAVGDRWYQCLRAIIVMMRWGPTQQLVVFFCLGGSLPWLSEAKPDLSSRGHCPLAEEPVIELSSSDFAQSQSPDGNATDSGDPQDRRRLRGTEAEQFATLARVLSHKADTTRRTAATNVQVRKCPCTPESIFPENEYYCPISKSYCYVPWHQANAGQIPHVVCVNSTNRDSLTKTVWPVALIWLAIVFLCLVCCAPGRYAMLYLPALCLPGFNSCLARLLMRRFPARAQVLLDSVAARWGTLREQYVRENPELFEDDVDKHPVSLALKTRVWNGDTDTTDQARAKAEEESNNDNEDDMHTPVAEEGADCMCSICFHCLEPGERVGELKCEHIFHADCLKDWLHRRNVCPLCLTTNIATPRYNS